MQVRIKGYTFQLASPYSEGSVLTAGEAQALNLLRSENIQNNFRSHVNSQVEKLVDGALLSQDVLTGLQAKLADYDKTYQFLEKAGRNRMGDIEVEARAVARERIATQLSQLGTELSPSELEDTIAIQAQLPSVIEEARIRVQARRSALAGGMESL